MSRVSVFMTLAMLCPLVAAANTCNGNDNCKVDDETSLVQVKSVVHPGQERAAGTAAAKAAKAGKRQTVPQLTASHSLQGTAPDSLQGTASEEVAGAASHSSHEHDEWEEYEHEKFEEYEHEYEHEHEHDTENWWPVKEAPYSFHLPDGCGEPICIGSAPFCGGAEEDCHERDMVPVGWTKRCFAGSSAWGVCLSGWKVHCAKCAAGTKAVEEPAPSPSIEAWTAPLFPTHAPEPTHEPEVIVLPAFEIPHFDYKYNANATEKAAKAMRKAYLDLAEFKAVACNVTKEIEHIKKNISLYASREKMMYDHGIEMRRAAVRYAKKAVLANITLAKAEKAMDDAYFAEKGSEDTALRLVAVETNQKLHKMAGEKRLIDSQEDLKRAQEALRIGQIAVNHAMAQLAEAKKLGAQQTSRRKYEGDQRKLMSKRDTQYAEEQYVKKKMEKAYAKASPEFGVEADGTELEHERETDNVPSWGHFSYLTAVDAGPPCHCVAGTPGCSCGWHPHP